MAYRLLLNFLTILILGSSAETYGQCAKAGFMTGDIFVEPGLIACVPFSLTASTRGITSKNPSYVFEYNGQDESKLTANPTYVYKKPGHYTILQLSTVDGKPARTCADVYVMDTIPPVLRFSSCGNTLTVNITTAASAPYDSYSIDWGDGKTTNDIQAFDAGAVVHEYTLSRPYRVRVNGHYRIAECGGQVTRTFTPGQPPHPPVISRLDPQGAQVRLMISNPEAGLYAVERKNGQADFELIAEGSRMLTNQFVLPLDTSQTNCFRLVQIDPCFPTVSYPPVCYVPPTTEVNSGWWMPTAFSPNGDGKNDTFGLIGQTDEQAFQLSIFNRWDTVIYYTTDPTKPWDGTIDGEPAPPGLYVYQVRNGRYSPDDARKRGTVMLLR